MAIKHRYTIMKEEEKEEKTSEKNEELEEESEEETEESEETEEETEEKEEVDYKEKFEEEEKLRKKAESSAQYHKEQLKSQDEPVTKKDLEEVEANLTRKAQKAQAELEAGKLARNDDERKLILLHYEKSIVPTGDIVKDIRRSWLMANESKIEAENEELRIALESRETRSTGVSGGKPPANSKEPQVTPELKKLLSMNKMQWDSKDRVFKNKRGATYDLETDTLTDPPR